MIAHAAHTDGARRQRNRRPDLAHTACNRWVDTLRMADPDEDVTCSACVRAAEPRCATCGGRLEFVAVEADDDTSYRCTRCGYETFGSVIAAR